LFFTGPVKNNTCFVPGVTKDPCEVVQFAGFTNYSEGTNDTSAVNDQVGWTGTPNVGLGTPNPTKVKSALPKSGGTFFTGLDGVPSTTTYTFATQLGAPNPPVFSSASISLKKFELLSNDPNDIAQAQLCTAAGNFYNCYEAGIDVPGVIYTYVAGGTNYLTTILRIDSSEVISPFRASRVKVFYSDPVAGIPERALDFCPADGVPLVTDPQYPCIVSGSIIRYSNAASNGELRGDVQIEVHGLKNGFIRPK
jgi:hypothetical protein